MAFIKQELGNSLAPATCIRPRWSLPAASMWVASVPAAALFPSRCL